MHTSKHNHKKSPLRTFVLICCIPLIFLPLIVFGASGGDSDDDPLENNDLKEDYADRAERAAAACVFSSLADGTFKKIAERAGYYDFKYETGGGGGLGPGLGGGPGIFRGTGTFPGVGQVPLAGQISGTLDVKDDEVRSNTASIKSNTGSIKSNTDSINFDTGFIKAGIYSTLTKECILDTATRQAAREVANDLTNDYVTWIAGDSTHGGKRRTLTQNNVETFWHAYRENETDKLLQDEKFGKLCLPGTGDTSLSPAQELELSEKARSYLSAKGYVPLSDSDRESSCENSDALTKEGLDTETLQGKINFLSTHGNVLTQTAQKSLEIGQAVERTEQQKELLSNNDDPTTIASFDEECPEYQPRDRFGRCPVTVKAASGVISDRFNRYIDQPFLELGDVDEFSELFSDVTATIKTEVVKKSLDKGLEGETLDLKSKANPDVPRYDNNCSDPNLTPAERKKCEACALVRAHGNIKIGIPRGTSKDASGKFFGRIFRSIPNFAKRLTLAEAFNKLTDSFCGGSGGGRGSGGSQTSSDSDNDSIDISELLINEGANTSTDGDNPGPGDPGGGSPGQSSDSDNDPADISELLTNGGANTSTDGDGSNDSAVWWSEFLADDAYRSMVVNEIVLEDIIAIINSMRSQSSRVSSSPPDGYEEDAANSAMHYKIHRGIGNPIDTDEYPPALMRGLRGFVDTLNSDRSFTTRKNGPEKGKVFLYERDSNALANLVRSANKIKMIQLTGHKNVLTNSRKIYEATVAAHIDIVQNRRRIMAEEDAATVLSDKTAKVFIPSSDRNLLAFLGNNCTGGERAGRYIETSCTLQNLIDLTNERFSHNTTLVRPYGLIEFYHIVADNLGTLLLPPKPRQADILRRLNQNDGSVHTENRALWVALTALENNLLLNPAYDSGVRARRDGEISDFQEYLHAKFNR